MQSLTLTIAICCVCLVLYLKPKHALAVYFIQLLWYPSYLRLTLGTADISVSRVVISALLFRCLLNPAIKNRLRKNTLDMWVTGGIAVYTITYLLSRPSYSSIENRGGFLMDSLFVYWSARYCIRNCSDLVWLIKRVALAIVPLAVISGYESVTGRFLFLWLRKYCPWNPEIVTYYRRMGLHRAWGPFSHPIMFGCAFGMFAPLVWTLRQEPGKWGKAAPWLTLIVAAGGFFSVSSSVIGMLLAMIFVVFLEKKSWLVKPILMSFIMFCVVLEVFGTTPFYRWLLAKAAVGGGGWVWRSKLIECAMRDIDEWWLLGYGGVDPGWGAEGFLSFTDLTNEFIAYGVSYGIWGVIALVGILTVSFKMMIRCYRNSRSPQYKSLYWGFSIFLVGLIVVWTGVSFFGQATMILYGILGMIGSSANFTEKKKLATTSCRDIRRHPIHRGAISC